MSTKIVTAGAILSHKLILTAISHALLRATLTRTVTVSAVVAGRTQSVPVSAVLRKTVTKPSSATGVLRATVQRTFNGNTVLRGGVRRTFVANCILKRGRKLQGSKVLARGVERTFSTNAVLFPAISVTQLTTTIKMVLQRRTTKTVTVSAVKVVQTLAHVKTVVGSASLSKIGSKLGVETTALLTRSGAQSPRRPFSSFHARTSRR